MTERIAPIRRRRPLSERLLERSADAERRYETYKREVDQLLSDAQFHSGRGNWSETAVNLLSAQMSLSAMIGVSRELRVLYDLTDNEET